MTFVVDASVAIKWFVSEEFRPEARRLLVFTMNFVAPDLIVTETANIAWKKVIRREIDLQQAKFITNAIQQYIPVMESWQDLVERALDIGVEIKHPIYDCMYLACAEKIGGTLVTADRRLLGSIKSTAYARLARFVGDIEIPPKLKT
ncbi:MAG: type II toxin-antitoxin system VapC family toxin [Rhodospirillales bacterium]|nr:type II toxin-antitoxin system VapC family toxin [Xanthobacteraceae bacterium]MCW5698875.1 type II toxin-antitoxin system VapC family toxin [Rhodospirillales bacterium]